MKDTKGHYVRITKRGHQLLQHLKAEENRQHPETPLSQGAIVEQLAEKEFKRLKLDPKKLDS